MVLAKALMGAIAGGLRGAGGVTGGAFVSGGCVYNEVFIEGGVTEEVCNE